MIKDIPANARYDPDIVKRSYGNAKWRRFRDNSYVYSQLIKPNGSSIPAFACSKCNITYTKMSQARFCCFDEKKTEYNLEQRLNAF